jgi:hypothetical protein
LIRSAFFLSFSVLLIGACSSSSAPPSPKPVVVTTSSAAATPAKFSFDWPTPDGWKKETIPFPLDFAPSLPYQGQEELRFGPKFFKEDSPTYFTYAFAFVLDHAPPFTTKQFAEDVKTYFNGLASAVTKEASAASLHDASFTGTSDHFEGTVKTIDAFSKDHHPISLHVVGESKLCGDHRIVLASLSPKDPKIDREIWETLAKVRASFVCH